MRILAKRVSNPQLDGVYVIRTSLAAQELSAADCVRSYKALTRVERACCTLKTADLQVRAIHHRLADRVRAHLLLCMLAYYVEWHMREAWRPLLYAADELAARARRRDPVEPAEPSDSAQRRKDTRKAADGTPLHSFRTLLEDLARVVRNDCRAKGEPGPRGCEFELDTQLNSGEGPRLGVATRNPDRNQHRIFACKLEGSRRQLCSSASA